MTEVDVLYEKHKDDPGFDKALAMLDKAGLLSPIVVVPPPSKEDAMSQQDA